MRLSILTLLTVMFSLGCAVEGPFKRGDQLPTPSLGADKPSTPIETGPPAEEPPDSPVIPASELYRLNVEPLVESDCMMCHPGKITGYTDALERIVPGVPSESLFLTKGMGQRHRKIWLPEDEAVERVTEWIEAEAR